MPRRKWPVKNQSDVVASGFVVDEDKIREQMLDWGCATPGMAGLRSVRFDKEVMRNAVKANGNILIEASSLAVVIIVPGGAF